MEILQNQASKVCTYSDLKVALEYFVPADPAELDWEGTDAQFESIDCLEPIDETQVEHVEGVKVGLIAHDRNYLDFYYWGSLHIYEQMPHGKGFAICANTYEYCYIGNWRGGRIKGYGQKFVSSKVEKSVFIGFFTGGTYLERKGLQQDIHYRIARGQEIVCKRFVESNGTSFNPSASVYQQNYYSGRDKPEEYWHLPESVKVEHKSELGQDPRSKKGEGKFEVVQHGELWSVDGMNRSEKIEKTEGTRRVMLKSYITEQDYNAAKNLGRDRFVQVREVNRQVNNNRANLLERRQMLAILGRGMD